MRKGQSEDNELSSNKLAEKKVSGKPRPCTIRLLKETVIVAKLPIPTLRTGTLPALLTVHVSNLLHVHRRRSFPQDPSGTTTEYT